MKYVQVGLVGLVGIGLGLFAGYFLANQTGRGEAKGETKQINQDTSGVVYRIGDVVILEKDLEVASSLPLVEASREDVIKALKEVAIAYEKARREGLAEDPVIKRLMYWAEKNVLAQEYYKRKVLPLVSVDTSEVLDYINQHKQDFGKEIALLMVAYRDPKLADTLKKLLKDGSYAANLMLQEFQNAGKIMVQPTGYQNLGVIKLTSRPEEYALLKKAKVGDVVGPLVLGPNEHVLAKVVDVRRVNPAKLGPEVKQLVYNYLLQQREKFVRDSLIAVWEAELR